VAHWPYVTHNSGLSVYGLNSLWKGDEHPAYAPSEYGLPLPLPLPQSVNFMWWECPYVCLFSCSFVFLSPDSDGSGELHLAFQAALACFIRHSLFAVSVFIFIDAFNLTVVCRQRSARWTNCGGTGRWTRWRGEVESEGSRLVFKADVWYSEW